MSSNCQRVKVGSPGRLFVFSLFVRWFGSFCLGWGLVGGGSGTTYFLCWRCEGWGVGVKEGVKIGIAVRPAIVLRSGVRVKSGAVVRTLDCLSSNYEVNGGYGVRHGIFVSAGIRVKGRMGVRGGGDVCRKIALRSKIFINAGISFAGSGCPHSVGPSKALGSGVS